VLDAEAKASAFRRLTAKWRAMEVPSALLELHGRATRALEVSTDAFTAEAEGTAADSKERIEAAKKTYAEVLAEVEQASKES
jgi:phosphate uptake regulator